MTFAQFITHFIALLIVANPFIAIPVVLKMSRYHLPAARKRIAFTSTISIGIILLLTTWIGVPLLDFLGIRLPAFQMAGGLVLLTLAFSMLNASESPMKQNPQEIKQDDLGAVVPLAIPIVAGPATLSAVVVNATQYPGFFNHILLSISALLVTAIMGIIFLSAPKLENLIGQQGINIISRLSGLLLAAIAIQLLATGAIELFPGLGTFASFSS